jgi:ankyrin repeat protein
MEDFMKFRSLPGIAPVRRSWIGGDGLISMLGILLVLSVSQSALAMEDPTLVMENINLLTAAQEGDIKLALLSLKNGADINYTTKSGWTPLHFASGNKRQKIVGLLLSGGAYINCSSEDGWTPLHLACFYCDQKNCKTISRWGR